MEVRQIVDDKRGEFVFGVALPENNKYTVWFSNEYYQKLTGGKITPDELIKKSFEFLLERESPSSILPEFDLSVIAHYFPDYELFHFVSAKRNPKADGHSKSMIEP